MAQRFLSLTGFVLAGGTSRRMGRDKTQLRLGGQTLAARQVRLLEAVCRSVAVIGPAGSLAGLEVPVIPDELPGHGPLGGIYTGLRYTRTELNLFLGCDMPFMEARFLRYLCARALAAVRASLASGDNKVSGAFSRVRCLILPWRDIARDRFAPRLFINLNTPQDYEDAKRGIEGAPLRQHDA